MSDFLYSLLIMNVTVLLSCMHQRDNSIIYKSNIQTDCVIINQCDIDSIEHFTFINKAGKVCLAKFISSTQRGLSKSRNMAIQHASTADICLICDDDEWLDDNYEKTISSAYEDNSDADFISFALIRKDIKKRYPLNRKKMGFKDIFSTSSVQITFRRNKVIDKKILFDEHMGSGTGNGAGEENKFMFDCKKCKLNMYYVPAIIATINPGSSSWFRGYNEDYFINHGWSSRRVLGSTISLLYIIYFVITHYKLYKKFLSMFDALILELKGWRQIKDLSSAKK